MKCRYLIIAAALLGTLWSSSSSACTTACLSGAHGPLIAKSYDWHSTEGLVFINKAGVQKSAFLVEVGVAATWTSKYASVTFNQYGREMPNGGMNTAGLVVEIMWLPGTETPAPDQRPAINELQWIQYQLDNHSTLLDVMAHAPDLRVAPIYGAVHYLVCDRSGQCAAFEYLQGKLVITSGAALKAPVLANHTYQRSVRYLNDHKGFGGDAALRPGPNSLDRFTRAAAFVHARPNKANITDGFELLRQVSQGSYSVWNIVYDPVTLRVHFRSRDATTIKTIDLNAFSPSCSTPVLVTDLNTTLGGDISTRMKPYSLAQNRALIQETIGKLRGIPSIMVLALAGYPESLICTSTAR